MAAAPAGAPGSGWEGFGAGTLRGIQGRLLHREVQDGLLLAVIEKLKILLAEVVDRFPFPLRTTTRTVTRLRSACSLKVGSTSLRGNLLGRVLLRLSEEGGTEVAQRQQDRQCRSNMAGPVSRQSGDNRMIHMFHRAEIAIG